MARGSAIYVPSAGSRCTIRMVCRTRKLPLTVNIRTGENGCSLSLSICPMHYETGHVQKGLRVPCPHVGHGHTDRACPTRLCSVSCVRTRVSEDCQCVSQKQDTFCTKKMPRNALNQNFNFLLIICKCGEGSKVCLLCG